jgi:hypothetical protein
MKGKRAWLRIVEAFIAVLIVAGALLVILSKQSTDYNIVDERVYDKQSNILDIIGKNDSLRGDIIIGRKDRVNETISRLMPSGWKFSIAFCKPNEICNTLETPNNKEIYASEMLVTSNLTFYNTTKLRFFIWLDN